MRSACKIHFIILLIFICWSCDSIDDDRIPNMPVNISLADAGLWNTYGVSGFGNYRVFMTSPRQPANFPFNTTTATGFGGVLLIEWLDPFSGNIPMPLAYDMACPVERNPETKIRIDESSYMAVCDECGSFYDVTMQRGAPVKGPAAGGEFKCALKSYSCIDSGTGGYYIRN